MSEHANSQKHPVAWGKRYKTIKDNHATINVREAAAFCFFNCISQ